MQNIEKIQKNGRFNFKIPDEREVFTAVAKYVKYRDAFNYYWAGSIINQDKKYRGEIQITWKDGKVFCEVNVKGRHFTIENLNGDEDKTVRNPIHVLVEKEVHILDQMRCGVSHSKEEKGDSINQSEIPLESRSICPKIVRIMVLYTPAAANAVPNINAYIDQKWGELEMVLTNSQVNSFQVQLAYSGLTTLVNDQVSGSGLSAANNILNQLQTNSTIESLRIQHKADLVSIITNNPNMGNGDIYGVANQPITSSTYTRSRAYSVVHFDHTGRYTFVHEIGHNFGCGHHDEFPGININTFPENRIYWGRGKILIPAVSGQSNGHTIMAEGSPLNRIPYFSNPNLNIPIDYFDGVYPSHPADISLGIHQGRQSAIHLDSTGKWFISNYEIGGETLQASLQGPSFIYNNYNFTWCPFVTCGNVPPFSYDWQWSPDGINFYNISTNECISLNPSYFNLPYNQTIFLKLQISGPGGVSTDILPVYVANDIYALTDKTPKSPLAYEFKKISTLAHLFPNPILEDVNIEMLTLEDVYISIELFDSNGQLEKILKENSFTKKGKTIIKFNFSGYKSGLKFIRINDGHNPTIVPIVIK